MTQPIRRRSFHSSHICGSAQRTAIGQIVSTKSKSTRKVRHGAHARTNSGKAFVLTNSQRVAATCSVISTTTKSEGKVIGRAINRSTDRSKERRQVRMYEGGVLAEGRALVTVTACHDQFSESIRVRGVAARRGAATCRVAHQTEKSEGKVILTGRSTDRSK